MKSKNILLILSIVITILLIPLIAMQFTTEVNWKISDFIVAGVLLLTFGFLIELVIRKVKQSKLKAVFIVVIILLLLLIWIELAVGLFNSPISGS